MSGPDGFIEEVFLLGFLVGGVVASLMWNYLTGSRHIHKWGPWGPVKYQGFDWQGRECLKCGFKERQS